MPSSRATFQIALDLNRSLTDPLLQRLPVLYRAGCNHLLDLGNSNPDQFAEEAVKYYQILHDDAEKGTDEGEKAHTLALLEQAKASLEDARRRVKPPQACEPCGLEGDDGEEGAEAEVDGSHDTNDAEPMAEAEVEAQEQDIGTTDIVSQPSSSDLER